MFDSFFAIYCPKIKMKRNDLWLTSMMYVLQRLLSLLYLILWSGFYLDEVLFCFIALLFHLVAMKEEKSNKCFNTIIILSITFGFCSKCKQVHNCDRCQLWYQFMFGLHYYSCNIKHKLTTISHFQLSNFKTTTTFYILQWFLSCSVVCVPSSFTLSEKQLLFYNEI